MNFLLETIELLFYGCPCGLQTQHSFDTNASYVSSTSSEYELYSNNVKSSTICRWSLMHANYPLMQTHVQCTYITPSDLQLPLRQWSAGNVYLCLLVIYLKLKGKQFLLNIAEIFIDIMGL